MGFKPENILSSLLFFLQLTPHPSQVTVPTPVQVVILQAPTYRLQK